MHELGLSRSIAAIVREHADGRGVKRVSIALGPLACVERRALTFCWDLVTDGTNLQGSVLKFIEAQGDDFRIKDFEFKEKTSCVEIAGVPTPKMP